MIGAHFISAVICSVCFVYGEVLIGCVIIVVVESVVEFDGCYVRVVIWSSGVDGFFWFVLKRVGWVHFYGCVGGPRC